MSELRPVREPSPTKPFHALEFIKRYWKRTFKIGTALFVLITPVLMFFFYTYFSATGILRVSPTMPALLNSERGESLGNQYGSYVKTQVLRLSHYEILMAALNRLPEAIKDEFVKPQESLLEAAQRLQKELTVIAIPNTQLISLTMRGNKPNGLAEVINSVVNVYLEKVAEEEAGLDNRRLAYLRQEQKQVEARITAARQKMYQLSSRLGLQSFNPSDDIYQQKRVQVQQAYLAAQTSALQHKINVEKTKEYSTKELDPKRLEAMVEHQLSDHPLYVQTRQWTYAQVRELNARLSQMSEDNPEREFITQRIETLESDLENVAQEVRDELTETVTKQQVLQRGQEVAAAEAQLDIARYLQEELKQEYKEVEKELTDRSQVIQQGLTLNDELERLQNLHKTLETRIYSLSVESKAPGRISLEALARSVRASNMKKLLAICVFCSYGLTFFFFLVTAARDGRIRTRKEAEDALGAPPSWPIPTYGGSDAEPLSRVLLQRPDGKVATAIRSLAVKLNKARLMHDARVILFTGVGRRAGTTKLCVNAAQAMAAQCKNVLLIDLNHLSPAIDHMVHGTPTESKALGLPVEHDEERGIDVLNWQTLMKKNRVNRSAIGEIVAEAAKAYDCVLIDSAPLIRSDLTEFLAIQSDIVVPVVAGEQSAYFDAYNTTTLLHRLEVKAICPCLNWIKLPASKRSFFSARFVPKWWRRRRIRRQLRREKQEYSTEIRKQTKDALAASPRPKAKKPGFFGRLFGRKKKQEETEDSLKDWKPIDHLFTDSGQRTEDTEDS